MGVLLDTDHFSILQGEQSDTAVLRGRVALMPTTDVKVSIISFQEQVKGWLAWINRAKKPADVLKGFFFLHELLRHYNAFPVLPFDEPAMDEFLNLQQQRIRIATNDLRIAAIAKANGISKGKGKAQDEDRDEQEGQQRTAKSKGKASDVVEIDLSKLPPDLAKEIRDRLKKKSGSKESREGAKKSKKSGSKESREGAKKSKKSGSTISLTDAIKIVEATGKGEVERAGRRLSKGETQFYVEINTGERHRTRITLNANGKILSSKKAD